MQKAFENDFIDYYVVPFGISYLVRYNCTADYLVHSGIYTLMGRVWGTSWSSPLMAAYLVAEALVPCCLKFDVLRRSCLSKGICYPDMLNESFQSSTMHPNLILNLLPTLEIIWGDMLKPCFFNSKGIDLAGTSRFTCVCGGERVS